MRQALLTIVLISCYYLSYSQRVCGTEAYVQHNFVLQKNAPSEENTAPPRDTVSNEIITIPVVVHIMYNKDWQNLSEAQVLSQIAALNRDYRLLNTNKNVIPEAFSGVAADSRIMFCIAKVDPNGFQTNGIERKYTNKTYYMSDDDIKFAAKGGLNAWDSKRYLNIWVCSIFGRVLGYATPPGGDPLKDGVVINFDVFGTVGSLQGNFNQGRTATHEVGHWLGLKHIWGDDFCGSDDINDTPRQKSSNFGCPSFPSTTDCSMDSNGDMFMNYMDLTNDACMSMFTTGQKHKMRAIFALNGPRNSFLRSYQCDSSLATGGPLPQDTVQVNDVEDLISIYPNPVLDFINIKAKQLHTLQGKTAIIMSAQGLPLVKKTLQSGNERISIGHLPPGIYMLSIGDGSSRKTFKLLKM